jgi:hypothetical protein
MVAGIPRGLASPREPGPVGVLVDQHLASSEVNIAPLEGDQLAASGAQHHGQAQEQAQLRILLHRRGEQSGHSLGVGRRDLGAAAGEHLDLEAAAALPDHPASGPLDVIPSGG